MPATIRRCVFGALALSCVAAAWSGCAEEAGPDGGAGGTFPVGAGGTNGLGGSGGGFASANGGAGGGGVCVSTSEKAEPTPLDIVLLLDRSSGYAGEPWTVITSALGTFFEDPVSDGISVGMVYLSTVKPFADACDADNYKVLDVPIAPLPGNTFALTNSMPADAAGGTPLHPGLQGALMAATAYQDAHPTHKVILVMTGDGDFNQCTDDINPIAAMAKSAFDYNGVRTYVIAVQSPFQVLPNLDKIAEAGGTTVYDALDISDFSEKMTEIRAAALGCDFEIPPPPGGQALIPDEVNFTYTPGGTDTPITLPRADDLADCGDKPGWYYDNNVAPTKIIVCPASCATIQNDSLAEVAAAFGCASQVLSLIHI